jgi:hypothetical protein
LARDVSDLTPEQARKILAAVEPMMDYTGRLTRRMQAAGWKPTDSFYVHAHRDHDALHPAGEAKNPDDTVSATAGGSGRAAPTPSQSSLGIRVYRWRCHETRQASFRQS